MPRLQSIVVAITTVCAVGAVGAAFSRCYLTRPGEATKFGRRRAQYVFVPAGEVVPEQGAEPEEARVQEEPRRNVGELAIEWVDRWFAEEIDEDGDILPLPQEQAAPANQAGPDVAVDALPVDEPPAMRPPDELEDPTLLTTATVIPVRLKQGRRHPPSGPRRGTRGHGRPILHHAYLPQTSAVHEFIHGKMMVENFKLHDPNARADLQQEAMHRFSRDGYWMIHIDMQGNSTRRVVTPEHVQVAVLSRIVREATDLSNPVVVDIMLNNRDEAERNVERYWDAYHASQGKVVLGVCDRFAGFLRRVRANVGMSVNMPPRQ